MHWTKVPDPRSQCFTFLPGNGDREIMFYIQGLMEAVVANKPLCKFGEVHVTKDDAEFIRKSNGLEQSRLDRLPMEALKLPILFVLYPDKGTDYTVLVDGTHRYVKAYEAGLKTLRAVFIPKEVWDTDACKIEGFPEYGSTEELHASRSGL